MNLQVIFGLTARRTEYLLDTEFITLPVGSYPIRAIDGNQFEIESPNGILCYLLDTVLEEKIKNRAAIIVNSNTSAINDVSY